MSRRVLVHKEIKDGMETIDLLTMQRCGLVDQVKAVDKNLSRLKNTTPFATRNIHHKFDVQDLESNRKNIMKETDQVDKLIISEFASGAREMRWKLVCIAHPQDAKSTTGAEPTPRMHGDSPETRNAPDPTGDGIIPIVST